MSDYHRPVPPTSAFVDISVSKNEDLNEAFQFDDPTVTTWDLNGKTFTMSIKGAPWQTALITLSGADFTVADPVLRLLRVYKTQALLAAALSVGEYVYDLLMTETGSGVITQLMHGKFNYAEGVT